MPETIEVSRLPNLVGTKLEPTDWVHITQDRINQFADATNDHQFIHVDPERAAQTPFGGPIAHGYLVLSLSVFFQQQIFEVKDVRQVINCGLGKVRFGTPVKVGSRIRMKIVLDKCRKFGEAIQMHMALTIEVEGEKKAACRAESITRVYI